MGLEHYGFAFYIFILVCGVLFVYRQFFSDIRQQQKLLDEKESKLLKLYRSLEDVMEEFYDSAEQAKGELNEKMRTFEREFKMMPTPLKRPDPAEPAARPVQPQQPAPVRREAPAPGGQPDFRQSFQAAHEQAPAAAPPPRQEEASPWIGMRGEILRLAKEGKDRAQIAKELNITQNEVSLVLGLNKS